MLAHGGAQVVGGLRRRLDEAHVVAGDGALVVEGRERAVWQGEVARQVREDEGDEGVRVAHVRPQEGRVVVQERGVREGRAGLA